MVDRSDAETADPGDSSELHFVDRAAENSMKREWRYETSAERSLARLELDYPTTWAANSVTGNVIKQNTIYRHPIDENSKNVIFFREKIY